MRNTATELRSSQALTGSQEAGKPDAVREKIPPARTRRAISVLMFGPGLDVKGGVSVVEGLLLQHLPPEVSATHVATMTQGSRWRKLLTFGRALVQGMSHLRRRPHVVHIHFASGASSLRKMILARLALSHGASVVMHAHGGWYRTYWEKMSPPARKATLNTLRRAHRLIVLGEGWRNFFVSIGVPRHKIVVMPNPVVLPKSLPKRQAGGQVRFVYLGLISARKGVFDLIEAAARLPAECRARARFVIAGNGENARLRELAVQRGVDSIVEVRDWVGPEERDRLLASADAFVLPSYTEGLPMALLETMAWGLPPICTPVGSIPEFVYHGANGLVVQPGDVEQLAKAIEQMVTNDERRAYMGRVARATVEPLAADLYAERICTLYRSVARR